jgi:protein-S-isoprenylcysteine O-methyltransferase Ste14
MYETERGAWRAYIKPSLRVMAATGIFAALHSWLASHAAKGAVLKLVGKRILNALYRTAYISQSVASFTALTWYIRRQPGRTLYHAKGRSAWGLRSAQLASLGVATLAAREVGFRRISGLQSFAQWQQGNEVQPEPEAQGPSEELGELRIEGPFKWSRHPLNFWPLGVLWLNPRMTTNLLAFNVAASIYLILGSMREELRLKTAYGDKYVEWVRGSSPTARSALRAGVGRPSLPAGTT